MPDLEPRVSGLEANVDRIMAALTRLEPKLAEIAFTTARSSDLGKLPLTLTELSTSASQMALDDLLGRDLGERGRTIIIRRATPLDIASIMAVVETVVTESYSHLFEGGRVPKPDPSDPWATAWVAEAGQAIVGVGLATGDAVDDLWISKSYRGLGLGARLLTSLETQIAGDSTPKPGCESSPAILQHDASTVTTDGSRAGAMAMSIGASTWSICRNI